MLLFGAKRLPDAARSLYFPSISLTGSAGYGAASLGALFGPAGFVWSIGGNVLQSIFDGGRIHAQNDLAQAQHNADLELTGRSFDDVHSSGVTVFFSTTLITAVPVMAAFFNDAR